MADNWEAGIGTRDLNSLFGSAERNFLVSNNGDQVKISFLKGKKVGLYFSASWDWQLTPTLRFIYNDRSSEGDLEIVFCSADKDDESFNGYFSKMPWLAIPFSDKVARDRLHVLFKVNMIPHLVLLDDNGKTLNDSAAEMIEEYEDEAYPFTKERADELEEQKRKQRLRSILVSGSCNFVISAGGKKLPVSDIGGKFLGLYFASSSYSPSIDFTSKLLEVYEKLKGDGESFEIVMIPLDNNEEAFKGFFETMPWFALPVKDKRCQKLAQHFKLSTIPTLVIIGPDGAILEYNVAEEIKKYGSPAYPFTPEKLGEVAAMERARKEAQALESCLIMEDRDFVIGKDDTKILVSELLGKNILLYFSAHCPCHGFTPKLIEAYNKIKAKDTSFEIIFVSSDKDKASFDEYFSLMPWLALPFGDKRKASLNRNFFIPRGVPKLIAIGTSCQIVSDDVIDLILVRGSDVYPFTEERLREIDEELEEMAEAWPEKVKHKLHDEHELVLTRCGKSMNYGCEMCYEGGSTFSYRCVECDIDLHPKCAMNEEDMGRNGDGDEEDEWVCDGKICYRP